MDWSTVFTSKNINHNTEKVAFLDIGCGYGGLLINWPWEWKYESKSAIM